MIAESLEAAYAALGRLTEGTDYPACEGVGEYYECHQATQRSQLLLNAVEYVLGVLVTEKVWPSTGEELADRVARAISYELSKPLDS